MLTQAATLRSTKSVASFSAEALSGSVVSRITGKFFAWSFMVFRAIQFALDVLRRQSGKSTCCRRPARVGPVTER
jgi:hypothetical protein